ncbi:hypothetical protein PHISP_04556 [Aspergillus sp. HF37]|nr:hypothetical protein PHISP_04556 [Aspergillus sp. HF37]
MNPKGLGASYGLLPSRSEINEDHAQNDTGLSSISDAEHLSSQEQRKSTEPLSSTNIHRSAFILVLVGLYAFAVLFAWNVMCIQTERPITTGHYGLFWEDLKGAGSSGHSLYEKNENWYMAARVLQAAANVSTIPLTSAVCSSAAVVYAQRSRRWSPSTNLTLRQMMTLANNGWVDLNVYTQLMTKSGRKRHASPFLILTMLMSILGLAIAPLQQAFMHTKTIKTPTIPLISDCVMDIPHHIDMDYEDQANTAPILMMCKDLESATPAQFEPLLWSGANTANTSCTLDRKQSVHEIEGVIPRHCFETEKTLRGTYELPHPFLAQLPRGYSTGLVRQFLPRVNSSVTYEVAEEGFPANCDQIPGAYFVQYSNNTETDGFARN